MLLHRLVKPLWVGTTVYQKIAFMEDGGFLLQLPTKFPQPSMTRLMRSFLQELRSTQGRAPNHSVRWSPFFIRFYFSIQIHREKNGSLNLNHFHLVVYRFILFYFSAFLTFMCCLFTFSIGCQMFVYIFLPFVYHCLLVFLPFPDGD